MGLGPTYTNLVVTASLFREKLFFRCWEVAMIDLTLLKDLNIAE